MGVVGMSGWSNLSTARGGHNRHVAFDAYAAALVLASAAAFYVPALRATRGDWPVPLDDVFIHFDFARALVHGHPFEWVAGQGYCSGETAPLYAVVVALGYALGFHGLSLGVWTALVACVSLWDALRSLRALLAREPPFVAWAGAALFVSAGVVDWSWFSGMELAFFTALLLRATLALDRALRAPPTARARAQLALGLWGAALVWTRPEAAVIVAPFAVIVARGAGSLGAVGSLLRAALPGAIATLAVLALNWALTGDPESAGARLKLLASNPYLSDLDRARELGMNLLHFEWKVMEASVLPSPRLALPFGLLCAAGLAPRRTRAIAAAVLVSAVLWALLVSANGAARYQNFRYYVPAVALLFVAAALGVAALARVLPAPLAALLAFALPAGAAWRARPQVDFFRAASLNVHDQQVEVGRRLARVMAPGDRVLVNDAGAIPYVAGRGAMDALGLGGFHRLPFTRAAVSGQGSTAELLQRLPPGERPAWLALYPNWFGALTASFGREVDRVTIHPNVICGGPTKVIYRADWSALDARDPPPGRVLDALDVADVTSEAEHAYASPAPLGGWTVLMVLPTRAGAPMFDGGRIIPEGQAERFVLRAAAPQARLVLRSDAPVDARVTTPRATADLHAGAAPGAWLYASAWLGEIRAGDAVTITARRGALRDFHVWLLGAAPSAHR